MKKTRTKSNRELLKLTDDVSNMVEAAVGYPPHFDGYNTAALCWRIGKLFLDATKNNTDSARARTLINDVAQNLAKEYGNIYSHETLHRMGKFAKIFTPYETVVTLMRHLNWNHFNELIDIEDQTKREFYAWSCLVNKWSVEKLRSQIKSELYETTDSDEHSASNIDNKLIQNDMDPQSPNSKLYQLLKLEDL